jgi:hypothetical protein
MSTLTTSTPELFDSKLAAGLLADNASRPPSAKPYFLFWRVARHCPRAGRIEDSGAHGLDQHAADR